MLDNDNFQDKFENPVSQITSLPITWPLVITVLISYFSQPLPLILKSNNCSI